MDEMHAWTEQELRQAFQIAIRVCHAEVPGWAEMSVEVRFRLLGDAVKAVATLISAYEG
jgi:hypothetical protein